MENLEFWLKGPVPYIPALLQPVAHALLQVQKELKVILADAKDAILWEKPKGMASVGFHLQHLSGVLDRLFTYANGQMLLESQLNYLSTEGVPQPHLSLVTLQENFDEQVTKALQQLQKTDPLTLTEIRHVGRKRLETTVIGLLFHAAEHTTRHYGQLLVTVNLLK
ncbi:DinB family protein [Arenibacter sp. GZD96]|uniref:DinB family protein n=1 Tax=Aurantibrevibacter litoralis TaxID=3106030 RepID=UPI002AFFA08E|nr:DinB family protein [Arenibacter sp. GZD-96]MEA1784836.1 DinB family protein [Arenibacter sp. GZD-96]